MANQKITKTTKDLYLTRAGLAHLESELKQLKQVDRKEIIAKIKEARNYGDLAENAEYHTARERQAVIEGRIEEIEAILKKAKLIEHKLNNNSEVEVGSQVKVKDGQGEIFIITIVGSAESDPLKGLISAESPLGTALIGSKKGDKIEVPVPDDGLMYYEILAVE